MGKKASVCPEQTQLGAGFLSLSRIYFARRQLPESSSVEFVNLSSWPYGPGSLYRTLSHL